MVDQIGRFDTVGFSSKSIFHVVEVRKTFAGEALVSKLPGRSTHEVNRRVHLLHHHLVLLFHGQQSVRLVHVIDH